MQDLLYIMSPSYSGSTLLTSLLAAHPGIATVGELKASAIGDLSGYRCSCGPLLRDCPFWKDLGAAMQEAGRPFELADFRTHFRNGPRLFRWAVGSVAKNFFFRRVGLTVIGCFPPFRRRLGSLLEQNEEIIRAVTKMQNGRVFLDASKDPDRLFHLQQSGRWNLRVIHLLRDGRGVANSYIKHYRVDVETATRQWLRTSESCHRVASLFPDEQILTVHYEDLCRSPETIMKRIREFAGLTEAADVSGKASDDHILGNAMRLKESFEVRLDESWKEELQPEQVRAFARIARRGKWTNGASQPAEGGALNGSAPDRTGRASLLSNVLFTWVGQFVFFAAGFVMPRMIDRRLGQELLGVWDFSWSLVTYFRLVEMGITSSVNRHVARFWANRDLTGVNRVVSSATFVLGLSALVIFLITLVIVGWLPYWFGSRLHEYVGLARGSVFFLGAALTVQTSLGAFNGVLTGCHRWELQSVRLSAWHLLTVAGMLIALWRGAGLVTLAAITFTGQALAQVTMVVLAYRVCPGLRLRRTLISWDMIRQLYIFSGKTLTPTFSAMLLNQTTSLLILAHLGPAALALFTRPRSLLTQLDALQRKMAMILTPTTSSLDSAGHHQEIRNLLGKSVRYSLYLVLPLTLVFVTFGGAILQMWMGPRYANWVIPAILSLGFLGSCVQTPIVSMLEGLNRHGRPGAAQLVASIVSVVLAVSALRWQVGLTGVALAVTLPLTLVNVIYLPLLMCRHLEINAGAFFRETVTEPLVQVLPFAVCLVAARSIYRIQPVLAASLIAVGSIVLMVRYWRVVLPERIKRWAGRCLEKLQAFSPLALNDPTS